MRICSYVLFWMWIIKVEVSVVLKVSPSWSNFQHRGQLHSPIDHYQPFNKTILLHRIAMRTYSWLAGSAHHLTPPSPPFSRRKPSSSFLRVWSPLNKHRVHKFKAHIAYAGWWTRCFVRLMLEPCRWCVGLSQERHRWRVVHLRWMMIILYGITWKHASQSRLVIYQIYW